MSKQALTLLANSLSKAIRESEQYGTSEEFRKNYLNRVPHRLVANPEMVFDVSELLDRSFLSDKRLDPFLSKFSDNSEAAGQIKQLLRDAFNKQVKASKLSVTPERGGYGYIEFVSYGAAQEFINKVLDQISTISTSPKYGRLYDILKEVLGARTVTASRKNTRGERLNIDAGHLFSSSSIGYRNLDFGAYNEEGSLLSRVKEDLRSQKLDAETKKAITAMLGKLSQKKAQTKFKAIVDSVNRELDLNLKVSKSLTKGSIASTLEAKIAYLFLQPSTSNQILGSALRSGNSVSKWVESVAADFLDLESSKSINQMVDLAVSEALKGKVAKYSSETSTNKVEKSKTKVVRLSKASLPKLDTSKFLLRTASIKNKQSVRLVQGGKFVSLQRLIVLVNAELEQKIKENMGKGSARNILNYRSGRFAKSVRLLTLSATRQDALNVTYDYMKYPYQTFEPGFKQGTPTSRDPRTLIQKSIRQIINEKFAQELRYSFTRL